MLVGLVAQQLGNVTLYLLFVEVAYRADDIALKLGAGILHDRGTGDGTVQAKHLGVGAKPAGCCLPCLDILVGQIGSVHLALIASDHTQVILPLGGESAGESPVLVLLGSRLSQQVRVYAVDFLRDVLCFLLYRVFSGVVVRVLVGGVRGRYGFGRDSVTTGTDFLPVGRDSKRLTGTALSLRHSLPELSVHCLSRGGGLRRNLSAGSLRNLSAGSLRLLERFSEPFLIRLFELSLLPFRYLRGADLLLLAHTFGELGLCGHDRLLAVHALKSLLCRFSTARLDIVYGGRGVEAVDTAGIIDLLNVLGERSILGR